MSANRKRTLFIALGSLLASSTAVAVLTFQTDAGLDSDAATSGSAGSAPHTLPAQMAENVDVAGHTGESLALFRPDTFSVPAWINEAPVAIESSVDTPAPSSSETHSAPSDVVEATPAAGASSHSGDAFRAPEAIFALYRSFGGGGSDLPSAQSPFPPGSSTPEDPLTDFDSLLPPDSGSNSPDPIAVGTNPQDGGCDALTGCGSLDDPPGSVPGNESPNEEPPVATPVPEPGSMGLLAFGLALASFLGRRRRARV